MKRLIIGDIHGCFTELQELLDKAGLSPQDEIIALGDIVDRGPDSTKVLDFFRTHPNARSLIGNHDRDEVATGAAKTETLTFTAAEPPPALRRLVPDTR